MTALVPAHVPRGSDGAFCYLAWVAYPALNEQAPREKFAKAVIAGHHKATGKHPPPAFRGMKREHVEAVLNRGLDRIVKRRIPATWMALHQSYVSANDSNNGWGLNESASALIDPQRAANPAAGSVLPETMEPDNVRQRVWRESMPALAMTLALPLNLGDEEGALDPLGLLCNADWVNGAIDAAIRLAPGVASRFAPVRILIPYR